MFDDVVVHVDENPEEKATKGREDKSMGGAEKVLQGRQISTMPFIVPFTGV